MTSILDALAKKKKADECDRTLRVDCRSCGNEPDLGSIGCVRCLCNLIDSENEPDSILLRSGSEISIEGETVSILNRLASEYNSIHVGMTEKKCERCILSRTSMENEKWCDLSTGNLDEIIQRMDYVFVDCEHSCDCIKSVKSSFVKMKDSLESVTEDAARTAYRIIGV